MRLSPRSLLVPALLLAFGNLASVDEAVALDDVTAEQLEQIKDNFEALDNTISTTLDTLKYMQNKIKEIKKKYGNNPKYKKIIDTLEKHGLSKNVDQAAGFLGKMGGYMKSAKEKQEVIEGAIAFHEKWAPSKDNPVRSLELIASGLEELNSVIQTLDPSPDNILTAPITAMIGFYKDASTAFASRLTEVKDQIDARRGHALGPGGALGAIDEEKVRKYKGDDTINPYPYIKIAGGELWSTQTGDIWIWREESKSWIKLMHGVSCIRETYDGWRLAHGQVISLDNLIGRCNTKDYDKTVQAKQQAPSRWNVITATDYCSEQLFQALGLESTRQQLESAANYDPVVFLARYMFEDGTRHGANRVFEAYEENVLVKGEVIDSKGVAVPDATVNVAFGGASGQGTSGADGQFKFTMRVRPATDCQPSATVKVTHATKGADERQRCVDSRCVSWKIQLVDLQEIKALSVSADSPILVGETATFKAIATLRDDTTEDYTGRVTWSLGSNQVQGTEPGSVTNVAKLGGASGSATVKVRCPDARPDFKDGECVEEDKDDIDEAIEGLTEGGEGCDNQAIQARRDRLLRMAQEARTIPPRFDASANSFFKSVNDQLSDPCKNASLARHLRDANAHFTAYEELVETLKSESTDLIVEAGLCPDAGIDMPTLVRGISGAGSAREHMSNTVASMRGEVTRLGCDEDELEELGNETAQVGSDPEGGGTGGVEICGDGEDNDGDGLQDEGCERQGNANITVFVFDSGSAKDDIFRVSVAGRSLGQTPVGGARSFPISLPPGSYVATLVVIEDGGNVGTFTISISEGQQVLASQSGDPTAGGSVQIPFTVGQTVPQQGDPGMMPAGFMRDPNRIDFPGEGGH